MESQDNPSPRGLWRDGNNIDNQPRPLTRPRIWSKCVIEKLNIPFLLLTYLGIDTSCTEIQNCMDFCIFCPVQPSSSPRSGWCEPRWMFDQRWSASHATGRGHRGWRNRRCSWRLHRRLEIFWWTLQNFVHDIWDQDWCCHPPTSCHRTPQRRSRIHWSWWSYSRRPWRPCRGRSVCDCSDQHNYWARDSDGPSWEYKFYKRWNRGNKGNLFLMKYSIVAILPAMMGSRWFGRYTLLTDAWHLLQECVGGRFARRQG